MRAPSGATSSTTSAVTAEKKQLQQVLHTSEMTSPSSSESSVNSFTNKLEQATPEQLKSMKKEITDLQAAERGKRKSLSPNQSAVLEVIGKRVDTHLQKANEVRQKQNAFEEKIEEKVLDFAKGLDGAKNDKEKARLTTKMTNEIAKMDSSSRVEILKQVGLLLKNDEHRALGASLNTVEAVTVKIVKDNSNKAILEGLKAGHQIKDEAGNVTPLKELILFSGKDLIKLNDLFGLIHQDLVKNNGPFNEDNKLLEFCRLAIADDPKNAEMPNFKEIATLCKKNSVDMTPKETTPDLQITNGSRNAGSIFSELQTMGPADRIKAYHSLGKDLQSIQENLLTTISPSSINDETRAEITSYVQFQSKISGYFSDKISDQKTPQEQENAIKFCVDLAMYCKKNNDLMGAQAVFLSINQTQIWNLKDEGGKGIFDKVKQDGQYGAKMKELEILINM